MPWKPGQSGNPKGRPPKDQTMTDALTLQAPKEQIAAKLIEMALEGNVAAIKYIYDRIDGAPRQALEVSGEQEKPVPLIILRSAHGTSTSTG